jgi:hypothetical protein
VNHAASLDAIEFFNSLLEPLAVTKEDAIVFRPWSEIAPLAASLGIATPEFSATGEAC